MKIKYVNNQEKLQRCIEVLAAEERFAMDLEANSYHHYQEQICLIQLATPREVYIIDSLSGIDLSPLASLIARPDREKVMHGADYDGRLILRFLGVRLRGVFDTMLAAQILGKGHLGLGPLLHEYFGVSLDKRFQRADWSRRPLTKDLLDYAALDVKYLLPLKRILLRELVRMGREDWAKEEFKILEEGLNPLPDRSMAFLKLKGAKKLNPGQLAILRSLFDWREEVAMRRDLPPFRVLPGHSLVELAELGPKNWKELETSGVLSPRNLERYGRDVLQAIHKGRSAQGIELPAASGERRRRDLDLERRIAKVKAWRDRYSKEVGMHPGVLLPNSTITAIASLYPRDLQELEESGYLKRWQLALLGEELVKLLQPE
jgi:ribonuclease D